MREGPHLVFCYANGEENIQKIIKTETVYSIVSYEKRKINLDVEKLQSN